MQKNCTKRLLHIGNRQVGMKNTHVMYTQSDTNIPPQILDKNGDIVLSMCKICGAAEQELIDFKNCDEFINKYNHDNQDHDYETQTLYGH